MAQPDNRRLPKASRARAFVYKNVQDAGPTPVAVDGSPRGEARSARGCAHLRRRSEADYIFTGYGVETRDWTMVQEKPDPGTGVREVGGKGLMKWLS